MSDSEVSAFIEKAQRTASLLGLPEDFFVRLSETDDWAFCVQAHCVVETCINHMIGREARLRPWRGTSQQLVLDGFWSNLPLSGRSGKVRLLDGLGLLPKPYRGFIEELSTLRNKYCHDAKCFGRSICDMINSGKSEQVELRWSRLVGAHITDPEFRNVLKGAPKSAITLSLMSLLAFAYEIEQNRPSSFLGIQLDNQATSPA